MRYKATVAYKGTNFAGWQIQNNAVTAQSTMQECISRIFKQDVCIVASGRTDAGVHAIGQVIHFDLDTAIEADKIPFVVNRELGSEIQMLDCECVADTFHARFDAKEKTYRYKTYFSRQIIPVFDEFSLRLNKKPDVSLMRKAAKYIVGEHDFRCFMASGSEVEKTVRTIYSLDIIDGEEIIFEIRGNGFLYNMVRIIVGTLLDIGYGKEKPEYVTKILNSMDRNMAGKTVPAKGLCLVSVKYLS